MQSQRNAYKYKEIQIVIVGAGFDSKFVRYNHHSNRPQYLHFIEIDLPKIIEFKKKLCARLIQRHSNIKPPTFIAADLLDIRLKDLFGLDYE